jgi:hypothetical protein
MTPQNNFTEKLPTYVTILMVLGIVYFAVTGILLRQSTGTATITAFDNTANISVSQLGTNAQIVGTGTANVRLKPGSYLVAASAKGHISTEQFSVTAKKHTQLTIAYTQGTPLPTSENINFSLNELVIHGLNDAQIANLKELFFKYKKTAKTVSIDQGSVERQYRVPDSNDPYVLNFTGKVDSQSFKGTITYTNTQDIELTLIDPQSGNQLFDASSQQSVPTSPTS